jgi:ABC-type cobalamin/Fe3+-siderophores transport system ATPase subunit
MTLIEKVNNTGKQRMLSITNLTFAMHKKPVFKNLSATIDEGEVVGITGAAGSGKSTLISLIRNNLSDYEGNILIDNSDIKTINKKLLNNMISHYSSSQDVINPEAVVREWILGGRINHKKRLSPYSDIDREIADSMMTIFNLNQFAETRLKLISESSKHMASLAKVFAAQSGILLLEKPEAGLNINQKVLLSRCIKKYTASGKCSVILTSSDLNFIAGVSDRIIVLSENHIAETGTHRIITGEFIKKYFEIEAVVTKNIYSGLPEIQVIEES